MILQALTMIFDLQTVFDLRPNLQLLADVRHCFADYGNPERLSTNDLLDWLHSLPARSWDADGPLTAYKLARLLMPFGIRPRPQRGASPKTARGYQLKDFQEAWQKHLNSAASKPELANQKSEIANKDAACYGVTDFDESPISDQKNPDSRPGMGDPLPSKLPTYQLTQLPTSRGFPKIACSPECELQTHRHAQPKDQNYDVTKLSIEQIRERKEELMRELAPLFSQPVPPLVHRETR